MSDNFGHGEWDDVKVRHSFIRKVRPRLGGGVPGPLGLWERGCEGLYQPQGTHSHRNVLLPSRFSLPSPVLF